MTFSAPMVRKADTPNVLLREACKLCYALCREGQELLKNVWIVLVFLFQDLECEVELILLMFFEYVCV